MIRLLFLLCLLALPAQAQQTLSSVIMLSDVAVTGASETMAPRCLYRTFQASGVTSSGAGAATVVIQATNVASPTSTDWLTLGTITLTLSTTRTPDGFVSAAPWRFVRANVTAISGTGATARVWMGC
jgi:hypothetical protein